MKEYFITGATGAIGCALVPILLDDRDTNITLLIRADNNQHLKQRLDKLYQFWDFGKNDSRIDRITAVTGDIKKDYFGMDDSIYKAVVDKTTHIIHCAGNVRMNLPIEEARACSVDSARNVIKLAQKCKEKDQLTKIEFISTVGVGGKMSGHVPEYFITQQREFHNTYEQAKAEAEDYIQEHVKQGMPITVHRPSMVVGDSKTGKIIHFQIFYHLCEFLSGSRTFGIVPNTGSVCLDTVPADYVARVINWSSNTQETSGLVLHECSGPDYAIKISDLRKKVYPIFKMYRKNTARNITIPMGVFKAVLPVVRYFVPEKTKRAMKALPVFFAYLDENQFFENEKTLEILNAVKINLPLVDDYLGVVVNRYLTK